MRTALATATVLALAYPLVARSDDPARREFDTSPSRPAVLSNGAFAVETAAPQSVGTAHAELLLDYSRGLLSLRLGDDKIGELVKDRLALHAMGSYSFGPVEVGAHVPIVLHQSSDVGLLTSRGITGPLVAPIGSTVLGDARLVGKVPLLSRTLDLAGVLDLRLPTGDGQAFASDRLAANPQLVIGRTLGRFRLDGSLGYLFHKSGQYLQLVARDGVTYGLAASAQLASAGALASWRGIVDLVGQIPRGLDLDSERYRAPISMRAGVRARLWRNFYMDVGAGTGFGWFGTSGYGHEAFRVFCGLRWDRSGRPVGRPGDRDGDGVLDDDDQCPDVPGPAELDGCPDRDGDTVPDVDDACPDVPGPALNDGCPPRPDEPTVELETERISLKDAILFDTAKDTIKPQSSRILDDIAKILNSHPDLKRIRVEGHTDSVGGRVYNQGLSDRRSASVIRALVQRGVDRARLEPKGYGLDRPIASNKTALGRAKNRRVEFLIVNHESGAATKEVDTTPGGPNPPAPQKSEPTKGGAKDVKKDQPKP